MNLLIYFEGEETDKPNKQLIFKKIWLEKRTRLNKSINHSFKAH